MPAKKAAVVEPVVEESEMDDLDELEEDTEAPVEKPAKKARVKKEKVIPEGKTTKEVAAELGITPVKLRRLLRSDDFTNDHIYTRYFLDDATIERLKEAIAAGAVEKKPRTKKAASAEVDEISEELEELDIDEEGDEEESDELDLDEDEEEEV